MRVVIDVNILVSYGIGKSLADLPLVVRHPDVEIFACEELLAELLRVSRYPKLEKYLQPARVAEVFELLTRFSTFVPIVKKQAQFSDPKDNYLLDLCIAVNTDYLVTGDKPLLELGSHHQTIIIAYRDFCQLLRPFA